jgi:hypothetical protein
MKIMNNNNNYNNNKSNKKVENRIKKIKDNNNFTKMER